MTAILMFLEPFFTCMLNIAAVGLIRSKGHKLASGSGCGWNWMIQTEH